MSDLDGVDMIVRAGFLLVFCGLLSACVSSGNTPPLRTEEGRQQARDAYIQLGIGYLQQGITEQAKMPLQKALEIDPSSADAHAALAMVFQNELEPELADKHYRKALAQGKDTRIQNNYGSFLFDKGRLKEPYKQFIKASKNTSNSAGSRFLENMGLADLR